LPGILPATGAGVWPEIQVELVGVIRRAPYLVHRASLFGSAINDRC
jgi:hypothetical protein